MRLTLALIALPLAAAEFRMQQIAENATVVYAVTTADMNADGKPDIVAVLSKRVVWYENPTWREHVVLDRPRERDNVCLAVHDIDGDGKLDIALGASWQPTNTESGGTLQWLKNTGSQTPWPLHPISEEPTLHRIRFGDVDGDGQKELVVMPLHGRGNKPPDWQGAGLRVLVFRVPAKPTSDAWPMEVVDDSLHIAHNFIVEDYDGDGRGDIWVAAREGVHVLKRGASGWTKHKLGEGAPGEIKLGRVNRQRVLATVEPWHGNGLIVYEEPAAPKNPQGPLPDPKWKTPLGTIWPNRMIEERLAQGHALAWADFDGDGSDEIAAGWRDQKYGVAMYKRGPSGAWTRTQSIDGDMAAEDMTSDDLNGDGKPDLIAGGRATQNIRIYWNETKSHWSRHVVATGANFQTAVALDFNRDGKKDIIAAGGGVTTLYTAPDWKPRVLLEGPGLIHGVAMDVNRDGCMDFVGAQYSPGYVVWIECPSGKVHVLDDMAKGGVNGVHGLAVGDIDGDGIPDLAGNSAQPKGAFPESLAWWDGKTLERHIFAKGDAPGLSHYLDIGDLDGDGKADIACGAKINPGGNWFAFWTNAAKAPAKRVNVALNEDGATNVAIADVDGDGRNDLFCTRGHGVGAVWYKSPDWKAHPVDASLVGPHSLDKGDIDGDGDIDFVTVAKDSFIAAWFENDGQGNFTKHHIHEDQAAYDVKLVDMDGDGMLDVLVAGQGSGNVVWYRNPKRR